MVIVEAGAVKGRKCHVLSVSPPTGSIPTAETGATTVRAMTARDDVVGSVRVVALLAGRGSQQRVLAGRAQVPLDTVLDRVAQVPTSSESSPNTLEHLQR